jgi:hypothetical protein
MTMVSLEAAQVVSRLAGIEFAMPMYEALLIGDHSPTAKLAAADVVTRIHPPIDACRSTPPWLQTEKSRCTNVPNSHGRWRTPTRGRAVRLLVSMTRDVRARESDRIEAGRAAAGLDRNAGVSALLALCDSIGWSAESRLRAANAAAAYHRPRSQAQVTMWSAAVAKRYWTPPSHARTTGKSDDPRSSVNPCRPTQAVRTCEYSHLTISGTRV